MNNLNMTPEYKEWLITLKSKIRSVQIKAALAVSSALIEFYWELGKMISEKDAAWGSQFLENLSKDLKKEFPDMQGFSVTNLRYCRLFYHYIPIHPQVGDELKSPQIGDELKSPQIGDETSLPLNIEIYKHIRQIPWGHIKLLIGKVKDQHATLFYIHETIENGWSRDVLALQIKSNLYSRQGKAITNFKTTLPDPQSDLAQIYA